MNRKENYADLDKYRKTAREQKRRYYGKTSGVHEKRHWTFIEDVYVLLHSMSDPMLSEKIHRSVTAIQKRRWVLNHCVE